MDRPSAPAVPDPVIVAQAQGTANTDAARVTAALNRSDQNTPYGSLSWTKNPGDGDVWTSNISLDPRVQSLVDQQLNTSQGLTGAVDNSLDQVNSAFTKPIDYGALPAAPSANDAARQRVEDAMYGRATSRLDPQFQQQESHLRSDLMNRGLVEGSHAWNDQMDNFNRGKNDAYAAAEQGAVAQGGAELSRDFGLQTQARQNALTEQEQQRAMVLNELSGLRSGQQVAMPTFNSGQSGATDQPAPVAQSMYNSYQGALGQYNAQIGANNSLLGAGATVLGAFMKPF